MKPILIAAAVLLATAAVQAQEPSQRGRALLDEFCARCHAIGKTGASPHDSAPPFRRLSRSFDLDNFERQLQSGVMSGHPDMPEFKFSAEDAHAVGAYLRSVQE